MSNIDFAKMKNAALKNKPVRVCRTMHECCVCHETITCGDGYYDGGYGNRAHVTCVRATDVSVGPAAS
jgi:hypothetical protein